MFKEMNKVQAVRTLKEDCDLRSMEFKKLRDFVGQTIHVEGFYFSKGSFGVQAVIVGNGYKINMPKRTYDELQEIYKDGAKVKAILEGHMMLKDIKVINYKGKETTIYTYEDC